jgi:TPR repeat protein
VPLIDCNLSGETPWLAYEYVAGGTLAEAIPAWKDVSLARRLGRLARIVYALSNALGMFHQLDPPIVHRDIKPANVLMNDKAPRITDFGLGGAVQQSILSETQGPQSGHSVMLPTMLRAMGTMRYAPPEQMLGSPPNPRDDVYAVGMLAYQMIFADLKAAPGTDAADELRDLRIPNGIIALITRSVAINPDRRPKDMTVWQHGLAHYLPEAERLAVPARPPSAPVVVPVRIEAPAPVVDVLSLAETEYQRGEDSHYGKDGPPDYAAARKWYEKAAERGHMKAQNNLGVLYEVGLGVQQNFQTAREFYLAAATQGHAAAQNNLGVMCELGRGAEPDYLEALDWYDKAASRGHIAAQFNLGTLYEHGRGVTQDYARARVWYENAAVKGHARAQYALARLCELGLGQLVDYPKARYWYERAASQGSAAAHCALGVLDELGQDTAPNLTRARAHYEDAARLGHARAMFYLGELHESGRGVPTNLTYAIKLYTDAATAGDGRARQALARLKVPVVG